MSSIVVLGSKPDAVLPDTAAEAVITANAAVLRGVRYRERYGSRLIALVNSSEVHLESVRQALRESAPDEVLLVGEHVSDVRGLLQRELGLHGASVAYMPYRERHALLVSAFGWRRFIVMLDYLRMLPLLYCVRTVLPDVLYHKTYAWMSRSTGLNAILYARRRFPTNAIVVAGIGLEAGGHFYDSDGPQFTEKTARVDRVTLAHAPGSFTGSLATTDRFLSDFAGIPLWRGATLDESATRG